MRAEILIESFREHRRSLVWWTIGITLMVATTVVFYPSIEDSPGLSDYSKELPDAMRALFVGGELDLTSPVGYLNSQIFALLGPALLAIFAVSAGASAIAGDEERGLLDIKLAQPLSRRTLVLQQFAWLVLGVVILTTVLLLTVYFGSRPFGLDIGFMDLLAACISTGLFGLFIGSIALTIGCLHPGRTVAVSTAAAVATAAWMLDGLSKAVDWLEPFRFLSAYYQAFGQNPLSNGAPWQSWMVLALATLTLLLVSIFGLQRRDINQ
ncbi:MAG: ABC transporter permease subunit [Solirubrobacterales bacterium]